MSVTDTNTGSVSHDELDQQVVVFSLHDENYALPITSVREIIRYTTPKATGAASGMIQGMISLRGHVLPILDLSGSLGRTLTVDEGTKILVVELDNSAVGLIVDSVDEVLLVPAEQIEPIPLADSGLGSQIAKVGERLITLVDPERALGTMLN